METLAFDKPKGVCPPPSEIGTLGAFFHSTPASEQNLVRSDERLIAELVAVLDRQLLAAVETRSVTEFREVREKVIARYVRALRALQDTVINLVRAETIQFVSDSLVCELADDLERQRESRFGNKLTDQAVFTLWTVRKIGALGREIASTGKVPANKKATDAALLHEYRIASLWAQFHLDILFTAVKFDRPICEQVRETICDGLRASVNAYVIMKDALSLRRPHLEEPPANVDLRWDAEDEQLLASSMKDINVDFCPE
jgi:hypothetical protein